MPIKSACVWLRSSPSKRNMNCPDIRWPTILDASKNCKLVISLICLSNDWDDTCDTWKLPSRAPKRYSLTLSSSGSYTPERAEEVLSKGYARSRRIWSPIYLPTLIWYHAAAKRQWVNDSVARLYSAAMKKAISIIRRCSEFWSDSDAVSFTTGDEGSRD